MTQSEAVKLALESYYFQHGRRSNYSVVTKIQKAIKRLEKLEKLESDNK